jgi:hypothetical protein
MDTCNTENNVRFLRNGNKALDFADLPRCQAVASSTGQTCKRAAVKGKKYCGIHSGRYRPGPAIYNRPWLKHGCCTKKALRQRAEVRNVIRTLNELIRNNRQLNINALNYTGIKDNGF